MIEKALYFNAKMMVSSKMMTISDNDIFILNYLITRQVYYVSKWCLKRITQELIWPIWYGFFKLMFRTCFWLAYLRHFIMKFPGCWAAQLFAIEWLDLVASIENSVVWKEYRLERVSVWKEYPFYCEKVPWISDNIKWIKFRVSS